MSTDATIWAWRQRNISPSQKLVLLTMADRANEEHKCWPSNTRMQADTGLDRKTIYKCITDLESMGLLRVTKTSGGINVYTLVGVCGREDEIASPKTDTYPKSGTGPKSGTSPKSGQEPVQKTDRDQSQKRDTESKRESKSNLPGRERAHAPAAHARKSSPSFADKQPFGEFGNVMLTAEEQEKLVQDYGQGAADEAIAFLDLHIGARKGPDPYKSHNLALRKWVFDAVAERKGKRRAVPSPKPGRPTWDELTAQFRQASGGDQ